MTEQPGRYKRSSTGLIGALIVLLLVIGAYLAVRSLSRDTPAASTPTIDYVGVMEEARNAGKLVAAAPDPMPRGWRATSVRYVPGNRPTWHLGMLTDLKKYVGIEESRQTPAQMAHKFVGANATKGRAATIRSRTWQTWKRPNGDFGVTLRAPDETVLVGGSAGRAVVEDLTDQLALPKLDG
jgi:hypothetical protein